ncbi:MAG: histidine kinase [Bacteroidota bacterium]
MKTRLSIRLSANRRHLLGFNDLPIVLAGIPVVAFLMPLLFFNGTLENGFLAYWPKWKVSLFFTCFYWFTMRWFVLFFRSRFPEYKDTSKRVILMTGATIVVVLLLNNFCYDIHDLLLPEGYRGATTKFDYAKSTFMIVFLVLSIYEGVYFYHRWRLSLIETERLRQENISSQLDALKSQVNPHFLFNSLNTLTYLIPEDEKRAVRFVQRLSKVYRYILEIRDRSLITVAEELDFLDAYQFLLKERFGDNLQIHLQLDPAVKQLHMIPLSMQMLLENAIKHNIISKERPLQIEIVAGTRTGTLLVRNRLQPKKQKQVSTQVGLDNIRRRYAFYTNADIQISQEDGWFSVELPLLQSLGIPDIPVKREHLR